MANGNLTMDTIREAMQLMRDIPQVPTFTEAAMHPSLMAALPKQEPPPGNLSMFNGTYGNIRIIAADLTRKKQTKFPRSKKRRMQRKWAKRYTVTVPDDKVYMIDEARVRKMLQASMDGMWRNMMCR